MYGRDDLSCIVMNGVVSAIIVTKLPPMRPNAMLVVEEVEVGPSVGSAMSFCWPIGLMMMLFACKFFVFECVFSFQICRR